MRLSTRWAGSTTSVLLLGVLALSCGTSGTGGAGGSSQSAPAAGGTVTMSIASDWNSLDPQTAPAGQVLSQIFEAIYERLVAAGPNGKLIPYLAKSWKATPTSITFNLQSGVKCADGTPLTPSAVAASFKRLTNPATKFGAREADFGPGPYTITADDAAGTMTFSSGTPYGSALSGFADYPAGVVCPAGLANTASLTTTTSGSGPFTIETATHGDQMVLKARPDWRWGPNGTTSKSPGFPGRLVLKIVPNQTTAANQILTGAINMGKIFGPDVARLEADKSITHYTFFNFLTHPIVMNLAAGHPTADEAVREAIMLAVSPKDYLQAAYAGRGKLGTSLLAATANCYDANTARYYPKQDPAKARSILQAAGYQPDSSGAMTKGGQKLTLNLVGQNTQAAGPELLQTQLTNAGFTVKLNVVDQLGLQVAYTKGTFDLFPLNISSGNPDASQLIPHFSGPLISDGGGNWMGARIPALDAEISAATQNSGAESCKHWALAQEIYLTKHLLMPLVTPQNDWYANGVTYQPGAVIIEPWSIRRK